MCEFRIGQKVVCVNSQPHPRCYFDAEERLIENKIYTVTGVMRQIAKFEDVAPYQLILAEVSRTADSMALGILGYGSSRFRPCYEIGTAHFRDAIEQLNKAVASLRIAADRIAEAS